MLSVDVTKQSPYQFKQYFREWLDKYIRILFNVNDVLVFVTYQPPKPEWSSTKVIEHTNQLFGGVKHVVVIEQTFEKSNMYNYADYIDGYHSHLIMTESDYDSIKHELTGHDIVAKVVYDLEGLKYYLTKQAGDTHNWTLPILNMPINKSEPILAPETVTETIGIRIKLQAQRVLKVFRKVSIRVKVSDCFKNINKIYWVHMFINDT